MRPILLSVLFLVILGFSNLAQAQFEQEEGSTADSNLYYMGRVVMKKRDVQAITIKAADLEKMPFTDLKTVIGLYFNGVYNLKQNVAYVIDGVLNTDINAYSIFDIDEITLIQNAATVLNGINGGETLVLIKTKRGGAGNYGVNAAGQTNFVRIAPSFKKASEIQSPGTRKTRDVGSLYHQYYVSGYFNSDIFKAGVSADILHDVFPNFNRADYKYYVTGSDNRYKLHGYFDAKLGDMNTVSLNAGMLADRGISGVPLGDRYRRVDSLAYANYHNLAYTDLSITTTIATGFVNKLSGGFQRLRRTPTSGDETQAMNSYVAQENISYDAVLGDLTVRPNANFTFRQARSTNGRRFGVVVPNYYQKVGLLTPSITFGYLDFITLQGGFQTYLSSNYKAKVLGHEQTTPLPFASLTINPLVPLDIDTDEMRLTFFGSFAQDFTIPSDFSGKITENYDRDIYANAEFAYRNFTNPNDPYKIFTQIQGGVTLSVLENALSFNYNYSLKTFNTPSVKVIRLPSILNMHDNSNARLELHRAGIDFKLPTDDVDFGWRTSIDGNLLVMRDNNYSLLYVPELMRLVRPGKPFITGGFSNHLRYQNLYLDFDILYCTNQSVSEYGPALLSYHYIDLVQTFDLQNVDIGYKIPYNKLKNLEVYLNARNLFQNNGGVLLEPRSYIGGGFKVEL